MKKQWIVSCFVSILMFSACYKNEDIKGEEPLPKYSVEDSDDVVDHYIFEFYENYGCFILYDYQENDYIWNMSSLLNVFLVKQTDRDNLEQGIEYLKKVFFDDYSDDFKRKYFPFKILMADSVQITSNGVVYEDEVAESGLSFLALGKIRSGINEISVDSLRSLKGDVQATYWADFLYNNGKLQLSEAFWSISDDYYGVNLKNESGNSSLTPDEIDVKKYGFWDRDRKRDIGTGYCCAPDKTLDIYQFIQMIVTHTTEEIDELMDGYDKLKDKYNLLINHINDEYGFDIRDLSNVK